MEQEKIITFIDHIGRAIFGVLVNSTDTQIFVKNPAIIHIDQQQGGKMAVNTIPLYFREFVSEKNKAEGTIWAFNKQQIVEGINVENDPRLLQQYASIYAQPVTAPQAPQTASPKVVKLFDDAKA